MQYEAQTVQENYHFAEKFNSSCIKSLPASSNNIFTFCTNSLYKQNEVHIFEYNEDQQKIINNAIFLHKGIVNKIFCNPKNEDIFYTSFSELIEQTPKYKFGQYTCNFEQESKNQDKKEITFDFECENEFEIHSIIHSKKEDKLILGDEMQVQSYDLNKQTLTSIFNAEQVFGENLKLNQTDIEPHHSNLIANSNKNSLLFYDLRDKKQNFSIKNAHSLNILDMDFSPNKQYYMITGGEDLMIKFWDIRKTSLPVKVLSDSENQQIGQILFILCRVLQCKYNKFHDQLILSSADDGTINLHDIISVSSAPMLKYSMASEIQDNLSKEIDFLVKCYDEHDDSVTSIAWSEASAWVFASVSYQGISIVDTVPDSEKYKILL